MPKGGFANREKEMEEVLKREVEPMVLPLSERIVPDAWLNIPSCIVKGFQVSIENQEWLEEYLKNVGQKIHALDSKIGLLKQHADKEIKKEN